MRGILAGAFALIVLQVLVANPNATNAVGGLSVGVGKAIHWFLDPNTPAIPDHSSSAPAHTSSSTTPAPPVSSSLAQTPTPGGLVPGVPVS